MVPRFRRFCQNALPGKGGVAVHQDGQDLGLADRAKRSLLGARAAHRDRVYGFQVAGIRYQVNATDLSVAPGLDIAGCADVVLHVATAQDAARIDIFELGKDVARDDLPKVLTITFRRPRWLMASTAFSAPKPAAGFSISSRNGISAVITFQREALGAEVAGLDDLLEDVGPDETFQNMLLVRYRRRLLPCAPGSIPVWLRRGCA